jgi:hypothetical protein
MTPSPTLLYACVRSRIFLSINRDRNSYSKVLTIPPTASSTFLDSVTIFLYFLLDFLFPPRSVYVMETSRNADIPFSPSSSHAVDVIIRSSDDVDFYVMKGLLTLSSPDFFGTMFSLPRPKENIQSQGGLQIVPVTEESTTLRALLLSCYPRGFYDETSDGDVIAKAILAARKYAMDVAEKVLMQALLSHPVLVEKPLHTYALACHYGLRDLVRVAARNTLRFPVSKLSPSAELDYISGMDMYRLSKFRSQCVKEIWDWYVTTGRHCVFLENYSRGPDIKFIWYDSHARTENSSDSPDQACIMVYNGLSILDDFNVRLCDLDAMPQVASATWWYNFFLRMMLGVQIIPSRETVFNNEIYYRAIAEAINCETCGPYASEHLDEFRRQFAQALDEAVTRVYRFHTFDLRQWLTFFVGC